MRPQFSFTLAALLGIATACTAKSGDSPSTKRENAAKEASSLSSPTTLAPKSQTQASANAGEVAKEQGKGGGAVTPEDCATSCENLIRITLSELGELAFRLPPEALAKPRANCLDACAKATSESDIQKMRCLAASQATTTGELTQECGLDLQAKSGT